MESRDLQGRYELFFRPFRTLQTRCQIRAVEGAGQTDGEADAEVNPRHKVRLDVARG
jgi:hypothetical protein